MSPALIGVFGTAFQVLWLLIALVAMAFLIRLYLRTRMSGFIWLLVAVIVWPTIGRLLSMALPFYMASHAVDGTQGAIFSIILFGIEGTLGVITLVIAALLLDRQLANAGAAYSSVPPPAAYPATYSSTPTGLPPYNR